jgi:hypothetical protein
MGETHTVASFYTQLSYKINNTKYQKGFEESSSINQSLLVKKHKHKKWVFSPLADLIRTVNQNLFYNAVLVVQADQLVQEDFLQKT